MATTNYTIKILKNDFGKTGTGFNRKPIFDFTGELEKFNLEAFEKKLKSIRSKKIMMWAAATFFYAFTMRLSLSL